MRTVEEAVEVAIPKIKGSRFLGWIAPAADVSTAEAFVQRVRDAHPGATHWVYAWRLDPATTRSTDDGEPRGTAGKPVLDRLVGHDLEGVVLVVVRYYGGTKLGTGGLVRAYGAAASAAIEAAHVVEIERRTAVHVAVAARLEGPVRGVARAHGAEVVEVRWGEPVSLELAVTPADEAALKTAIQDRCAGAAVFT